MTNKPNDAYQSPRCEEYCPWGASAPVTGYFLRAARCSRKMGHKGPHWATDNGEVWRNENGT